MSRGAWCGMWGREPNQKTGGSVVGVAAKVGDEIGEGEFRSEFAGKSEEADVVADIIWHLLGDGGAFVRWHAARCLKGMLDVGLIEDIEHLLKRFDVEENASLSSDEHHFSYMNAQQWLLIGLARAALHHGDMLKPLRPRIESLAQRSDLHALNKLALVRCLSHIDGDKPVSPSLEQLWGEVQAPKHGIAVRGDWPESRDRRHKFGFDYEFNKYKIPELARLFHISENEANDLIADEVISRWPKSESMSDFPGGVSHQRDSKFETFREHVQKHAQLHAATRLAATRPVVRSTHDWEKRNPWQEFLRGSDVSFEDGSWLSDHKDPVPMPARERLLGERKQDQEYLLEKEALFQKTGFCGSPKDGFFPLFGHWKSQDSVHVRLSTALIKTWGAVGQCAKLAKVSDHELWLPFFGSDGLVDRFAAPNLFEPLIWDPEKYPIGIDEHDEWAARGAIARPKLGQALNRLLKLTPDADERQWHDRTSQLALKSDIWGEWRLDSGAQRSRYLDEGAILWAQHDWLERVLEEHKRSLVIKLSFSKYKPSNSYDDSSGVRELYVGLKRSGEAPRFWFAEKASETVY